MRGANRTDEQTANNALIAIFYAVAPVKNNDNDSISRFHNRFGEQRYSRDHRAVASRGQFVAAERNHVWTDADWHHCRRWRIRCAGHSDRSCRVHCLQATCRPRNAQGNRESTGDVQSNTGRCCSRSERVGRCGEFRNGANGVNRVVVGSHRIHNGIGTI
jgi:hypothetical protein